jgi:tetratricopeptide (TPR) repeat protein
MGNEEYAKGNHQKAIELYSKAIEIGDSEVYFANRKSFIKILGGQAYITIGKFESAIEDCETAILINP